MKEYRIASTVREQDVAATARARVLQVYRYLLELHRLRTPPALRLADRDWVLRLDGLPEADHLQVGLRRDERGCIVRRDDTAAVLRVRRPVETQCPEPSVMLKNWLKPGFDDPKAAVDALLKKSVKVRGGARQEFQDAPERVEAFEQWAAERAAWAEQALGAATAFSVFADLFELHARFERESEKYQLYLADGMLELDHDGQQVRHPLLLQRVELQFDPAVPEFRIVDSGDAPELFTPLLRHLGLDGHLLQELADAVAEGRGHPLAGDATDALLRDLVQRCWNDGQYLPEAESATGSSDGRTGTPRITRAPHLVLGNRSYGLEENLLRFLGAIEKGTELPTSLLRIVGIDAARPAPAGTGDLLFTKPANPEQIEVLRRLQETGAVLVQGPPGTGKSHTIANLIGHLLAENKSILVTSHASKALRVVREKLPKELQPLCVSVLQSDDESTRQLEESITGIVNKLASTSIKKLEKEIEKLQQQRAERSAEVATLQRELLTGVQDQYREIELLGERLLPATAAARLAAGTGTDDWIPGPVAAGAELPLSAVELAQLYAGTAAMKPALVALAQSELPELAAFVQPKDLAALLDEEAGLKAQAAGRPAAAGSGPWADGAFDPAALAPALQRLQQAVEPLRDAEPWELECVGAGCAGPDSRDAWLGLCAQIEDGAAELAELAPLLLDHAPDLGPQPPLGELDALCRHVAEQLDAGAGLDAVLDARNGARELLAAVRVGGAEPREAAHFWALVAAVTMRIRRETLGRSWDLRFAAHGRGWSTLGAAPEVLAAELLPQIQTAASWHDEVWTPAAALLTGQGLDWNKLRRALGQTARTAPTPEALLQLVDGQLPPLLQQREQDLRLGHGARRRERMLAVLDALPRKGPLQGLCQRFRNGIRKGDYDAYADAFHELERLHEVRAQLAAVDALLQRLEPVAPGWVAALRERQKPHITGALPGDPARAWWQRQWSDRLQQQAAVDLDRLQQRLDQATDDLFARTASYVEKSSWLAQLRRTGLQQQQALAGWLQLQKKIGKGTGKHVPLLQEEARKALTRCRSAVPVWIMPLSRVVESFDLASTRFDVVILDEASQCDVMGLLALALAREVVVVGDHEQVSPYAVGISADHVRRLIDEQLQGIPNRQLYDGKTSVYDLAQQSFGGTIRLLEHFRCVPDIIRFSNELCYGGEIRPLREASSARVLPALVAHRVDGEDVRGINEREAQEITALVAAMCRLEQYEGCTFGVISMIGTDQALYIDSLLRSRLSATEYRRRQILCGNASQFQGDERDVILLSMVNSGGRRALAMRTRDDARKVFNVAASRARDQLWVVHSLDPGRDLKGGDLRLRLISHAETGNAVAPPAETGDAGHGAPAVMRTLCEQLAAAGYRLLHRFAIGGGEIELVVEGQGGRRAAVECVGDRAMPADDVEELLQRQHGLRRLGWQFARVRAADLQVQPERALAELQRRLQELGVVPEGGKAKGRKPKAKAPEPLHEQVIQRAAQIQSRWQVPSSAELLPRIRSGDGNGRSDEPVPDGDDRRPDVDS